MCCLFLGQVQLLSLAELHWHEVAWPFPARAATADAGSGQPGPAGQAGHPCLACQIMRRNAVRPATATPPPTPAVSFSFSPAVASIRLESFFPTIAHGRAPPLS